MAIKSYTDLEQSKVLAEILPIESADMYYSKHDNIHANTLYGSCDIQYFNIREYIPCWSLAALISIIPYGCLTIHIQKKYRVVYNPNLITEGDYDSPVDACVEMILKLHELKML